MLEPEVELSVGGDCRQPDLFGRGLGGQKGYRQT